MVVSFESLTSCGTVPRFVASLRRAFLIAILAMTSFPHSAAHAAVNAFSALGPEGGVVSALAFHPAQPSTAYLGANSGFYRSTDGGNSWQLISNSILNGPRDIAVHPLHPSRVVVAGDGIFISDDSGASLLELSTVGIEGRSVNQIEYSGDGSALYALSQNRVLRSSDGGVTWTAGALIAPLDQSVGLVRADSQIRDVLYASLNAGSYRSADGGITWTPWNRPGGAVNDLQFANSSPRRVWAALSTGVWFSDNDGQTWSSTSVTAPAVLVSIDPANSSTIYTSTYEAGLQRSDDNGLTWSPVQGMAHVGMPTSFARRPDSNLYLLYGGVAGVSGSDDGGANWTSRNSGVVGSSVYELSASPVSDRTYVSTIHEGIHFVEGNGRALAVNNDPLRQWGDYDRYLHTFGLFVHPGQPDRLLVGVTDGIARSLDGGQSWHLLTNSGFTMNPIRRIEAASADAQVLIAMGYRKVFRSTNGGNTWIPLDGIPFEVATDALVAAPSNRSIVYMGTHNDAGQYTVLKSTDAGVTWTSVSSMSSAYFQDLVVDPRDDRVVYAATTQSLLKSVDGGATWAGVPWAPTNQLVGAFALDPADPDIMYAGNTERIARSVDGGATWERIHESAAYPFWDVRAMSVDGVRPHRLLVAANGMGLRQIDIQPDLEIVAPNQGNPIQYGQPVTLNYTVRNRGPFAATNVRARFVLSGSATAVSAVTSNGVCERQGTAVVCTSDILRTGATATIAVTFTEPNVGSVRIPASIEGSQPDPAMANNAASTDLQVAEIADLSVAATGSGNVTEGGAATYQITVSNAGPQRVSAVRFVFRPATGLTIATTAPATGTCSTTSGIVTCELGSLAASGTATISLTTSAVAVGVFASTFEVSGGTDLATANNSGSVSTTGTAAPPPPPPPPPTGGGGSSSGGGGGGGGTSLLMLIPLLVFAHKRRLRASR